MLETLSRHINYGKTYRSLEHYGNPQGEHILFVKAKENKGELNIVEKTSFEGIDGIPSNIKGHAHLVVNNHQVLKKETEFIEGLSDQMVVSQVFPNIQMDEFYYQMVHVGNTYHVYICRKTYLDSLISTYQERKIYITGWSLGLSSIVSLIPFLGKQSSISNHSHEIILENGQWSALMPLLDKELPNTYDIEGIEIEPKFLNTLSGLVTSFSGASEKTLSNFSGAQKEQVSLYKQHRWFQLGVPFAIGTLLVISLVNFLYYNHYYQKVEGLGQIGATNETQKRLLITKDSLVDQKQKLFEDVIESASSSSSLFIDTTIGTMPKGVLLDRLQYNPLLKKARKDKPMEFQYHTLFIEGKTLYNDSLSLWISRLESLDFVRDVAIGGLEEKKGRTQFAIEINTVKKK